jgi:uncharacterized protein (PEP-CTERM system associated)
MGASGNPFIEWITPTLHTVVGATLLVGCLLLYLSCRHMIEPVSDEGTQHPGMVGGRKFTALDWQLDYFNQTTDETGADPDQPLASGRSDRENLLGTVGYSFTEEFAINARAGYENNDVNDAISSENGSFWSLGFTWTPSRFISTTLFYGPDDKEIIVQLNPTSRTSFLVSRRDRSVGLDTGVVWEGTLEHRTRYSVWSASYTDSTVNGSVLLFDNQLVTCFSAIGNSIIANNLGLTPVLNSGLTLNSGDFRRKRFQSTVTYERARTNLSFDGYLEKRDFSLGDEEEGYGLGAAWSRNFGSNTMSMISTCWQHNEFNINQETDFWTTQIALTHGFTRDLTGALAYRFAQQNSSDSTFDYRENRIFLLLQLQF